MKTIECTAQIILKDGEDSVTNYPGSVISLPDKEAAALIAAGQAKEYIDPAAEAAAVVVAEVKVAADAPALAAKRFDGFN